jgi:hypothetical protein
MKLNLWSVQVWIRLLIFGLSYQSTSVAGVLPEFAYREIILKVTQADGRPVPGASVYGFCHELNLVWRPGRDHELKGRNDVLWHESYLGKTDPDGSIKATIPPGKWGFFAAGRLAEDRGVIMAAWTDFRERSAGETIQLTPTVAKHWVLCSAEAANLEPKRIFLKPEGFPIWIPASPAKPTGPLQIEMTAGHFQMWANGDATADHPGFAMDWGTLDDHVPDGKIMVTGTAAVLECKGGKGQASLSWVRQENFGLEGELNLCNDAKVLLTPGMFTLAYRRLVTVGLAGDFVGQCYNLREGQPVSLNMDTPLDAGLDQALSKPNKRGQSKLIAQLYLVDGNGHLLAELLDALNKPVNLGAAVILNEKRFVAHPILRTVETPDAEDEKEEEATTEKSGHMMFAANVGSICSDAGAVWEFTAPPELFAQPHLTKSEHITVTSVTFKMDVPRVIQRDAQNLLAQAEMLAEVMKNVSGEKRRVNVTSININPARHGASATHNGTYIGIGTGLFYSDQPMLAHTIVHELGHNFGFTHGGLHETVVEASRCAGSEQISGQQAKWMFMDRMNGMTRKETPYSYPNVGLYLYCYSQGGLKFLRFMSANEYAVIGKLDKQGYTKDEVTTALLSLALGRDMTRICSNYGLNITPGRVAEATRAARDLCRTP